MRAFRPEDYEVVVLSPPQRNLGIHTLEKNTQCGEIVAVKEQEYVVSQVTYQYKLIRGRYKKEHKRLDVKETSRYLLDMQLTDLLENTPRGGQDAKWD
mmetsp:Transcript_55889/g.177120  ORF Transcript_55889/g.177120 Transcript_55889/m.177120 type:complete len:98 (+) Transcript_55889:469-762(+)